MIEEDDWSKEQEANRKPGQKHPTPSPGFADRVFYESLLQQRADSHMAQKWCLEHGVLKWAEAEALCKKMGVDNEVFLQNEMKKQKIASSTTDTRRVHNETATAKVMGISQSGVEGLGLGAL
ncbi:unnamed protein product [Peronospora destructor]|uniref:Uncharacterized protein n=1 Tax=Peronospora destructor TaxID=86335 RepID=A0AAV0U7Z2_9STRA|nr:unnamed protein product [Peronospora destructor]